MSKKKNETHNEWETYDPVPYPVGKLRPHPRNYKKHPQDQIDHIINSIEEHGFYRNIVVAEDDFVLAGHGVLTAVQQMGLETIPVIRVPIKHDSKQALKILTGDNEISHLGEVDDRLLSELLREIGSGDEDELLGTGFDGAMLQNLVYVTRMPDEVEDFSAAAEWLGMPDYVEEIKIWKATISFRTQEERKEFMKILNITTQFDHDRQQLHSWWPEKEINDRFSAKFEAE